MNRTNVAMTLSILVLSSVCRAETVVDFTADGSLRGWHVEDDSVMGGRSQGALSLTDEGHALFSGTVSLENDGGFSSVQTYFDPIDVSKYRKAVVRVKGDGKRYQFRVQSTAGERHSYVFPFATTGRWQTVEIPFSRMYAQWRGNRLNLPNYPGKTLAHARFFIANGRAESFRLLIDRVDVK